MLPSEYLRRLIIKSKLIYKDIGISTGIPESQINDFMEKKKDIPLKIYEKLLQYLEAVTQGNNNVINFFENWADFHISNSINRGVFYCAYVLFCKEKEDLGICKFNVFGRILTKCHRDLKTKQTRINSIDRIRYYSGVGLKSKIVLTYTPKIQKLYKDLKNGKLLIHSSESNNQIIEELKKFLLITVPFKGTAQNLLDAFNQYIGGRKIDFDDWPKSARNMSEKISQFTPILENNGYKIKKYKTPGANSHRIIAIRKKDVSA